MTITVTGTLVEAPRKITTGTCSDAAVVFTIANDNPLPFEARLTFGPTAESHLTAEKFAQRFARGQGCTIRAEQIDMRRDHGAPCLVLRQVAAIDVAGVRV